MAMVGVDDSSA